MKNLEQFNLSKKYSVYRTFYTGEFSKENFLTRVRQNEDLYFYKSFKTENSLDINLSCIEFKSIDDYVISLLKNDLNLNTEKVAKSNWIYIQTPEFDLQWMHTHEFLESTNRTNLRTQWTYVFYVQIPLNLKQGDGNIIFKTEDGNMHTFIPKEKEILIFPGDLLHIATPSQSGKYDRVVYAGNVNLDFKVKNNPNKRVKFEEYY